MKNFFFVLFLCGSVLLPLATNAGEFKVSLVSRVPEKGDTDQNKFMLSINGTSDLGPRELHAFKSCVLDITVINPAVYGTSKAETDRIMGDLLKLTELSSVSEMNKALKQLTCKVYRNQQDPEIEEDVVTLTTPTDEGLDDLINNTLTECLRDELDTSGSRIVTTRLSGTPIAEARQRAQDEERYCPESK